MLYKIDKNPLCAMRGDASSCQRFGSEMGRLGRDGRQASKRMHDSSGVARGGSVGGRAPGTCSLLGLDGKKKERGKEGEKERSAKIKVKRPFQRKARASSSCTTTRREGENE